MEQYDALMRYVVPNRSAFVDDILSRRHAFSHGAALRAYEPGLFRLAQRLEFLLEACLLSELGFSDEQATEAVRHTSKFSYVMSG